MKNFKKPFRIFLMVLALCTMMSIAAFAAEPSFSYESTVPDDAEYIYANGHAHVLVGESQYYSSIAGLPHDPSITISNYQDILTDDETKVSRYAYAESSSYDEATGTYTGSGSGGYGYDTATSFTVVDDNTCSVTNLGCSCTFDEEGFYLYTVKVAKDSSSAMTEHSEYYCYVKEANKASLLAEYPYKVGNTYYASLEEAEVVAKISDNYYSSLGDAIAAAETSETTITLIDNTEENVTIAEGQNITLDLAGNTISCAKTTTITNNGTLTINDSDGDGVVSTGYYAGAVVNNGTLTINAGKMQGKTSASAVVVSGVVGSATASFDTTAKTILNGGTYVGIVQVKLDGDFAYLMDNLDVSEDLHIDIYSTTLTENMTIPENVTVATYGMNSILTIENGATLTNNGTLGGSGKFYATINDGGSLVNNKTMVVYKIINNGNLTNSSSGEITTSTSIENNGTFTDNGTHDYEAHIERNGEIVKYCSVTTAVYTALDGDLVVVAKDAAKGSLEPRTNITIDLGGHTVTRNFSKTLEINSDVTIKNGTLIINEDTYDIGGAIFQINAGASITLDDVDFTTSDAGFYPVGNGATVNILNNSVVTASVYGVTTNASSSANHGVVINIQDSKMVCTGKDETGTANEYATIPVMINVPGTLTVENSEIETNHVGVLVRGGTAEITNTDISHNGVCAYTTWASGSLVPSAGITLGNGTAGHYQYPTTCTIDNVTFDIKQGIATNGNNDAIPTIFADGLSSTNNVTLTLDSNIEVPADSKMQLKNNVTLTGDGTIFCYGYVDGTEKLGNANIAYDVNQDEIIDNNDILTILKISTGAETNEDLIARADINGDTKINSADAYALYALINR